MSKHFGIYAIMIVVVLLAVGVAGRGVQSATAPYQYTASDLASIIGAEKGKNKDKKTLPAGRLTAVSTAGYECRPNTAPICEINSNEPGNMYIGEDVVQHCEEEEDQYGNTSCTGCEGFSKSYGVLEHCTKVEKNALGCISYESTPNEDPCSSEDDNGNKTSSCQQHCDTVSYFNATRACKDRLPGADCLGSSSQKCIFNRVE